MYKLLVLLIFLVIATKSTVQGSTVCNPTATAPLDMERVYQSAIRAGAIQVYHIERLDTIDNTEILTCPSNRENFANADQIPT